MLSEKLIVGLNDDKTGHRRRLASVVVLVGGLVLATVGGLLSLSPDEDDPNDPPSAFDDPTDLGLLLNDLHIAMPSQTWTMAVSTIGGGGEHAHFKIEVTTTSGVVVATGEVRRRGEGDQVVPLGVTFRPVQTACVRCDTRMWSGEISGGFLLVHEGGFLLVHEAVETIVDAGGQSRQTLETWLQQLGTRVAARNQ